MSAPAGVPQPAQRRAQLIVEREYAPDPARCVAAIVKLLTYRPADAASDADSAGSARPPCVGDRRTMHNGPVSACKNENGPAVEDDHRDALTTIDAEF